MSSFTRIPHRISAVILAAWMFVCGMTFYLPRTPLGVHCPKAPIQLLRIAKAGSTCCSELRAPKLGDAQFVQCRCEEKRSAPQVARSEPRFEVVTPRIVTIDVPSNPLVPVAYREPATRIPSVDLIGPDHPPQV